MSKVASVKAAGLNGNTSSAIDTTGASLLTIEVSCGAAVTVSDSKGNTWTALTNYPQGGGPAMAARIYYALSPSVGSGHTFTVSGSGSAASFVASAWTPYTALDLETGVGGGASTFTTAGPGTGGITPSQNNCLVISCVALGASVSSHAAAGGTTVNQHQNFVGGTNYGIGSVYVEQTTAAAISAGTAIQTWTTSVVVAVATASFKQVDSTAPTLSSPTGTQTGSSTATCTVSTNEANGTLYCVVTTSSTPPTGAQVRAGQDSAGASAAYAANQSITTTGTKTFNATGLASSTTYYAHYQHRDAASNDSTVSSSSSFTTAAPGSPTAGTASLSSATSTTINVTCGAASGGTPGYTYQWYRSTTANFTPGGGNLLSGATSLTLADTASLAADTVYYYKLRVTDSAALTADSNQIAGALKAATLILGFVGDSIATGYGLSGGLDPATKAGAFLQKMRKHRAVTISNQAVDGSRTSQWVSGQSNMNTALSAFSGASVTHVLVMLGANDAAAANLVTASTYGSNLSNICSTLTGAGYTVILCYPTYIPAGANSNATTAASTALTQEYFAQIDALINGTTILRGDVLAYRYFVNALSEYQSDKTHPTATGTDSLGLMWAHAIDRALNPAASGAAGFPSTSRLGGLIQ